VAVSSTDPSPRVVQLFATCLVDGFAPSVGRAVVRLLEDQGLDVEFPFDQTCCGQPAFNAGHVERAVRMASHMVEVFDATDGPIVTPSGSCAVMLIHHAPDLLAGGPHQDASLRVAARVRELTAFLVDDLGVTGVGASGSGTVAYHPSCHGLRELGLRSQPEALIDAIDGIERRELPDAEECCGFGGLFSLELPEISAAILEAKIARIEESGADVVAGSDLSCLMHIGGGLRRRGSAVTAVHVAELLARGEGE
jgi:L-lactate dehydrogenase complex protein LldE